MDDDYEEDDIDQEFEEEEDAGGIDGGDVEAEGEEVGDAESDAESEAEGEAEADAEVDAEGEEPVAAKSKAADNPDWEYIYVIPENDRRTSHILANVEYVEAVSIRTAQIAHDGTSSSMVEITPSMTDPRTIAMEELKQRKCPLKLRRVVGSRVIDGRKHQIVEIWSPNEMTHPDIQ